MRAGKLGFAPKAVFILSVNCRFILNPDLIYKGERAMLWLRIKSLLKLKGMSLGINIPEQKLMVATRFCSDCGEPVKEKRPPYLPFRSFCVRCSPAVNRGRVLFIAALLLAAVAGYSIGRLSAPARPFYLMGTLIDPQSAPGQAYKDDNAQTGDTRAPAQIKDQPSASPESVETLCGAATKSGKPCRRKVRGGGYCWQHRDKYGAKK